MTTHHPGPPPTPTTTTTDATIFTYAIHIISNDLRNFCVELYLNVLSACV